MTRKHRFIYELNLARHTMMKSMDATCRDRLGVSVVQLSALMVIDATGGCLMKDLASELMLDKSAVTTLARRMEAARLVDRMSCDRDARATQLVMTAKARSVLKEGLVLLDKGNNIIRGDFSDDELETVHRFLQHIRASFSEGAEA